MPIQLRDPVGSELFVRPRRQIPPQRRDALRRALESAGFTITHSEGALYLWATRGEGCRDTVAWLADHRLAGRTKVLLKHGTRTVQAMVTEIKGRLDLDAATAAHIETEADRLSRMVSDLLDLSRLRAGGISLETDINTAEDLIGAATLRAEGVLGTRRIHATLDMAAPTLAGTFDLSFHMMPDPGRAFNQWMVNDQVWPNVDPLRVKKGGRYKVIFRSGHEDGHPLHLHRHTFELVSVGGKPTSGIHKDTVRVPRDGTVEVEFVADNPGLSLLHCHMQHHMDYGFKTIVRYV